MPSNTHSEAMRTLLTVRRRLADQFAREIVRHSTALTSSVMASDDPISSIPDLKSLCLGLNRIHNAIANLRLAGGSTSSRASMDARRAAANASSNGAARHAQSAERAVDQIKRYVETEQYEEASRVLSRLLHMPVDRAFTATRFFARALQSDAGVFEQVTRLCGEIETAPAQQVMRTLVHAFGLQAVECGTAMMALRERRRALDGGGASIAPTLAAGLIAAAPLD